MRGERGRRDRGRYPVPASADHRPRACHDAGAQGEVNQGPGAPTPPRTHPAVATASPIAYSEAAPHRKPRPETEPPLNSHHQTRKPTELELGWRPVTEEEGDEGMATAGKVSLSEDGACALARASRRQQPRASIPFLPLPSPLSSPRRPPYVPQCALTRRLTCTHLAPYPRNLRNLRSSAIRVSEMRFPRGGAQHRAVLQTHRPVWALRPDRHDLERRGRRQGWRRWGEPERRRRRQRRVKPRLRGRSSVVGLSLGSGSGLGLGERERESTRGLLVVVWSIGQSSLAISHCGRPWRHLGISTAGRVGPLVYVREL